MSFFDKIKDVTYVNCPEKFLRKGSDKIFRASFVKISALNKNVLDSRLVCTCQQIIMCATCLTYPKSVNDYFIPTRQG